MILFFFTNTNEAVRKEQIAPNFYENLINL